MSNLAISHTNTIPAVPLDDTDLEESEIELNFLKKRYLEGKIPS
jgi:hypothetical protein